MKDYTVYSKGLHEYHLPPNNNTARSLWQDALELQTVHMSIPSTHIIINIAEKYDILSKQSVRIVLLLQNNFLVLGCGF